MVKLLWFSTSFWVFLCFSKVFYVSFGFLDFIFFIPCFFCLVLNIPVQFVAVLNFCNWQLSLPGTKGCRISKRNGIDWTKVEILIPAETITQTTEVKSLIHWLISCRKFITINRINSLNKVTIRLSSIEVNSVIYKTKLK